MTKTHFTLAYNNRCGVRNGLIGAAIDRFYLKRRTCRSDCQPTAHSGNNTFRIRIIAPYANVLSNIFFKQCAKFKNNTYLCPR